MRRLSTVIAAGALLLPGSAHGQDRTGAVDRTSPRAVSSDPIVVGSKPFAESFVLAEIFAQLLESRGIRVDRRPGLGSTEILFQAVRRGDIDVYPEYTGTGLLAVLGEDPPRDRRAAYRRVSAAFRERWDARWLPPLGFQNTYAIAVRPETADSLGLRTLSDLAAVSPRLTAGFTPDFIGRPDGLEGLRTTYGIDPGDVRSLLQAVKYEALAAGRVDVIDGYGTDGLIARYGVTVLEDDLLFFPPYDAAPLMNGTTARDRPDVVAALSELAGLMDEAFVRGLNQRVEVDGEPVEAVARSALASLGLIEADPGGANAGGGVGGAQGGGPRGGEAGASDGGDERGNGLAVGGRTARPGLVAYLWGRRVETLRLVRQHLVLVGLSLVAAILVAVPLGLVLERTRGAAEGVIRGVGVLQTIPSIALLAFMIPVLGIGVAPAVAALFLYSLFPIVRNSYSGVRDADPVAVEAGRALGMTDAQLLRDVRLPLAAPVIMAGIRTAAVINVGTATLAAFIGAGGLGDPIVAGLALTDSHLVLAGAIPAAVLALVVDAVLSGVERAVTPRGL